MKLINLKKILIDIILFDLKLTKTIIPYSGLHLGGYSYF